MSFGGGSGGSSSIQNSTDVFLSAPTNGQVLSYDAGTLKWVNSTVGGGATTTADITDFAAEIRKTDANVFHDGAAYPLRSTATTDAARRVRWIGPTAPTIGSGYAIDGLDVWERTT